MKNDNKNKIENSEAHFTIIYPCIPMIPWVRVAVCCGVPKFSTVPVPAIPILEALRVYPYLCETLNTRWWGQGWNGGCEHKEGWQWCTNTMPYCEYYMVTRWAKPFTLPGYKQICKIRKGSSVMIVTDNLMARKKQWEKCYCYFISFISVCTCASCCKHGTVIYSFLSSCIQK
jgi:hypothetical protein